MITFLYLVVVSIGLLLYYFASEEKIALKVLGLIWGATILGIIIVSCIDYYHKPLRLTKSEIIGDYRIDTNFYSGRNATWQYDHFRFKITPNDSIIIYLTKKDKQILSLKKKILYSSGPPDLWKIEADSSYHLFKYPPILYRGYKKFYYVVKSDLYGNMFFKKVDN